MAIRISQALACFLLLIGCIAIANVQARSEDELGLHDWHRQHVGPVKEAHFVSLKKGSRVLVVITESNVLAGLNPKTGVIMWRQVYPESEPLDSVTPSPDGRYLVVVSGTSRFVKCWSTASGVLLWNDILYTSTETPRVASQVQNQEVKRITSATLDYTNVVQVDFARANVIVMHSGLVEVRSIATGELEWEWAFDSHESLQDRDCYPQAFTITDQTVSVVAIIARGKAKSTLVARVSLALSDGKVVSKLASTSVPDGFTSKMYITPSSKQAVAFDAASGKLYRGPLAGAKPWTFKADGVKKLSAGCGKSAKVSDVKDKYLLLQCGDELSLVTVSAQGGSAQSVKGSSVGALTRAPGQQPVLLVSAALNGDNLAVSSHNLESGAKNEEMVSGQDALHRRGVKALFAGAFVRPKDNSIGFRALVHTHDLGLTLVKDGKSVWMREEALSEIEQSIFVELPYNDAATAEHHTSGQRKYDHSAGAVHHAVVIADSIARSLERVVSRVQGFVNEPSIATLKQIIAPPSYVKPNESILFANDFGTRKLIVAVTKTGHVFALHTETGEILWKQLYKDVYGLNVISLDETRATGVDTLAECVLVVTSQGKTIVTWFNPLTGTLAKQDSVPTTTVQTSLLEGTQPGDSRTVVLFDDQQQLHSVPQGKDATAVLKRAAKSLFFWTANVKSGVVAGHTVNLGHRNCEVKWQAVFDPSQETIAAVVTPDRDEVVDSAGRILGDMDVLYKYLNKNLLAVATTSAATASSQAVHVYIIDIVTGKTLKHIVQRYASGPVHLVVSENFVVMTYWDTKHTRHEATMIELYIDHGDVWGPIRESMRGKDVTVDMSDPSVIDVRQSSFVLPTGVTALGVTTTARGITGKEVLFGLIGHQLYGLDKRWLDTRRPGPKPTASQMEEGLPVYQSQLPMNYLNIHSYDLSIANIRHISSSPALLESTSLIFATGLDLFFTLTSPSGSYDRLASFNYALLTAALSALVIATFVARAFVARRELAKAWK